MKKFKLSLLFGIMGVFMGFSNIIMANSNTLTPQQRGIIPIAAFTSTGDLNNLKIALNEGLDSKLTINEIKEILIHSYAYAGFPRSLNGINTFMAVLQEREAKGIKDEIGREATPVANNIDKNAYGEKVRTSLTGTRSSPAYQTFTPAIDTFLKEHLFADLFMRDNLDYLSRELTTISILSGLGNVNAQLRSHMNITMNLGATPEQMNDFISVLENKVSKEKAQNAQGVLKEVIANRSK